MNENDFSIKYIASFYMGLMNLNFVYFSKDKITDLLNGLRDLGDDLTDEVLVSLINDDWRKSKVAAWIIAIKAKGHLEFALNEVLSKKGIQFAEHLLLAKLILSEEDSDYFLNFAYQQIKYFNTTKNALIIENLSIDWVISILHYLDIQNKTTRLEELKASNEWLNFDNNLCSGYVENYNMINEEFEDDYYLEEIELMFLYLKA